MIVSGTAMQTRNVSSTRISDAMPANASPAMWVTVSNARLSKSRVVAESGIPNLVSLFFLPEPLRLSAEMPRCLGLSHEWALYCERADE